MSARRIAAAIRKELQQFFRDPVLLILVLWLYTLEVVICATALSFDLLDEPIGVLDFDRSAESASLIERFDRSPTFEVRHYASTEDGARALLDGGEARLVLSFPPAYGERLAGGTSAEVQLLVDGTNSLVAITALGQAQRLIAEQTRELLREQLSASHTVPTLENRVRIWYNPALRFTWPVVISMLATAAFMVGVLLPAAGIVKERERGTMEQLLVSPLRPAELLIAKTAPTLLIGLLGFGPGLLVAWAFGVPFRGHPLTLAVLSGALLVSSIGIGVVIATSVRTLQQSIFVTFFVLFPVIFLSGTTTPIESMPPAIEVLSRLSPLRHYVEGLVGTMLRGVGLEVLWRQLLWLSLLGGAFHVLGLALFRRRVT